MNRTLFSVVIEFHTCANRKRARPLKKRVAWPGSRGEGWMQPSNNFLKHVNFLASFPLLFTFASF